MQEEQEVVVVDMEDGLAWVQRARGGLEGRREVADEVGEGIIGLTGGEDAGGDVAA